MDSSLAVGGVRRFVTAFREIRGRLFADLPTMAGVEDLMYAVRAQGTMARVGRLANGIEYAVHGAGCRMTDEDGREVDVDPEQAGTMVEAFDAWRIRSFLDSDEPLEELTEACERLVVMGELRAVGQGRWFALPPTIAWREEQRDHVAQG